MRAPWYERAAFLYAAIRKATLDLQEPIDRVEVASYRILFWAGTKRHEIAYRYIDGPPIPGPGRFLLDDEEVDLGD